MLFFFFFEIFKLFLIPIWMQIFKKWSCFEFVRVWGAAAKKRAKKKAAAKSKGANVESTQNLVENQKILFENHRFGNNNQ